MNSKLIDKKYFIYLLILFVLLSVIFFLLKGAIAFYGNGIAFIIHLLLTVWNMYIYKDILTISLSKLTQYAMTQYIIKLVVLFIVMLFLKKYFIAISNPFAISYIIYMLYHIMMLMLVFRKRHIIYK